MGGCVGVWVGASPLCRRLVVGSYPRGAVGGALHRGEALVMLRGREQRTRAQMEAWLAAGQGKGLCASACLRGGQGWGRAARLARSV